MTQPDLFAPVAEPGFCFVCEQFRSRPLGCGPQCMETDYPRKDTDD